MRASRSTVTVSRVNTNSVPTDGSLNAGAGAVGAAIDYYPILPVRQPNGAYTLMGQNNPAPVLQPTNIPNPVSMAADVTDKLGRHARPGERLRRIRARRRSQVPLEPRRRPLEPVARHVLPAHDAHGIADERLREARAHREHELPQREHAVVRPHVQRDHAVNAVAGYSRQQNDLVFNTIQNSNFVSDIDVFENMGAGTQTGGPQVKLGPHALDAGVVPRTGELHARQPISVHGHRSAKTARRASAPITSGASSRRRRSDGACTDEPFMQRFPAIELLKFRASTGLAGNPSIQPYQSMAHLLSQQYTFGGAVVPGYYPASVGNPNLGWETTRQTDYGVDLGLYGGRVSFTGDIYRKKTSDLLLAVNLPFESGFGTALQNVGVGAVTTATSSASRSRCSTGAVTRSAGRRTMNYSHNKNSVLDLGGVQSIFAGSVNSDLKLLGSLIQVGQSLGVFYGYKTDGILRDSAAAAAYAAKVKPLAGTTLASRRCDDRRHRRQLR